MSMFTIAPIFSNNMVLQRETPAAVFGSGEDGKIVTAEIDGLTASTKVINGKWLLRLPPHAAGNNYTLKITCGTSEKTFENIAYGEVWLAGGQSNMEFELQNCAERSALTEDKNPNVRFYYTPKKNIKEKDFLETERNTCWSEFSPENAKCWSAVGYFFARDLAEKLGVTVGVVGCNWGGTSASYWMSKERLSEDIDTNEYLRDIEKATAGKTEAQIEQDWNDYCKYLDEWNKKSAEFYSKNPNGSWEECEAYAGKSRYPGPPCEFNPMSATALYKSMIQRICPYTLKGFIYYQGESDDHRPKTYYKLFTKLIGQWRDDWGNDRLPFIFVQLPMHRYEADLDWKHWCVIREAQMKAYNTIRNTGIAVALDLGEFNEIHPHKKQPVGHRLALQALYSVYGFENLKEQAFSPMYRDYELKDGGIELSFEHCYGFKTEKEPVGFEIAGADKEFKPAKAEIRNDRIFISADEVKDPLYARYNWTNYGEVTVYGVNGLPLAPFRTCPFDEKQD